MTSKERIILLLTAAINFTHILDFIIMMPLGNYLIPFFHLNTRQFSWLVAAYTITAGIAGFTAGFFMDRYDRKKALIITFSGFVTGTFFCGFAPSYSWLLTARMITGAFGGIIAAQVLAIVADTFPYERRGMAMGVVMSSISVASIVGVPMALWMVNRFNWHAPFVFVGILGMAIIPLSVWYLPAMNLHLKTRRQHAPVLQMLSGVVRNTSQVTALALTASLMLGHYLIVPFVNPYLQFNVGFNNQQTPLLYLAGGLAIFISSPLIGRLSDQFGKLKVYLFFALVSLIPVFLITHLPSVHYLIVLLITSCWFTLSAGRAIPAQAMITNVVETHQRGSFMSFNSSVQQLFIGLASVLSGVIVSQDASGKIIHYDWLGYVSIALIAISMLLAKKLARITN